MWSKMDLPSSGNSGANISVLGTLTSDGVGITSANAKGIFVSNDSGTEWEPLVRITDKAPGVFGTRITALRAPVNSKTGPAVAFRGTFKGSTVTMADNEGIWFSSNGHTIDLVARKGDLVPGAVVGARWKSFPTLALPGGSAGPLFTAILVKGTATQPHPSSITNIDDFGLYMKIGGTVLELLRENQPLLNRTVKSFEVLKVASGAAGATRSFNSNSQVVALVTFTDGIASIVRIDVP
jgi:hypothetical protein